MARTHFMPRSYLWGLADILHVGVEGRVTPIFFMNRLYMERAPFYFFPTVVLIKVPLGLTALALLGVVLVLLQRRAGRPPDSRGTPALLTAIGPARSRLLVILLFGGLLLFMLIKGTSSYAGMRHALIVLPSACRGRSGCAGDCLGAEVSRASCWCGACNFAGNDVCHTGDCVHGSITTNSSEERTTPGAISAMRAWSRDREPKSWQPTTISISNPRERFRTSIIGILSRGQPPRNTFHASPVEGASRDRHLRRGQRHRHARSAMLAPGQRNDYILDYSPLLATQPVQRYGNLMIFRGTFALPDREHPAGRSRARRGIFRDS